MRLCRPNSEGGASKQIANMFRTRPILYWSAALVHPLLSYQWLSELLWVVRSKWSQYHWLKVTYWKYAKHNNVMCSSLSYWKWRIGSKQNTIMWCVHLCLIESDVLKYAKHNNVMCSSLSYWKWRIESMQNTTMWCVHLCLIESDVLEVCKTQQCDVFIFVLLKVTYWKYAKHNNVMCSSLSYWKWRIGSMQNTIMWSQAAIVHRIYLKMTFWSQN